MTYTCMTYTWTLLFNKASIETVKKMLGTLWRERNILLIRNNMNNRSQDKKGGATKNREVKGGKPLRKDTRVKRGGKGGKPPNREIGGRGVEIASESISLGVSLMIGT